MKWLKLFITVLIITVIFSGCSFRLASSVDELISPVAPEGDNADVQSALESFCKGGFSLKTPVGGEYTTSYIFYDVDLDGVEEAVAFYEPAAELGTINMAVIDKSNGNWSVISNIVGEGTGIYSVDFSDVDGDEVPEIIALWDVIKNSTSHSLSVYGLKTADKKTSLLSIGKEITTNAYIAVDIDGDSVNELMMFTAQNGDSDHPNALLYSYKNSNMKLISKTKLDSQITSYKNIISEKIKNTVYVYADALNSNGLQMHTEVIYWSDHYDSIISPFYSYSTGLTKKTVRKTMLTSRDINDDSMIEIPLDAAFDDLPPEIEAINWKQYKDSVLDHVCYSVAIQRDNYQLVISDDYFDDIKVLYDEEKSILTVCDKNDNVIFTVVSLLKPHFDENSSEYSKYTQIMNNSGYVYLAKTEDGSDIKLTAEDLKTMIKAYKGE